MTTPGTRAAPTAHAEWRGASTGQGTAPRSASAPARESVAKEPVKAAHASKSEKDEVMADEVRAPPARRNPRLSYTRRMGRVESRQPGILPVWVVIGRRSKAV